MYFSILGPETATRTVVFPTNIFLRFSLKGNFQTLQKEVNLSNTRDTYGGTSKGLKYPVLICSSNAQMTQNLRVLPSRVIKVSGVQSFVSLVLHSVILIPDQDQTFLWEQRIYIAIGNASSLNLSTILGWRCLQTIVFSKHNFCQQRPITKNC